MSATGPARVLGPGDEGALEAFLAQRADTSMFLRANLRRGGIVDRGVAPQGTFAGAFDDAGALVAVAAHFWNGKLVLQAPERVAEVAHLAATRSGRAVDGLVGPWDQVCGARATLGLDGEATAMSSPEVLMTLALGELVVPEALASARLAVRHQTDADLPVTVPWRVAYCQEALGLAPGPELERQARDDLAAAHARSWVVEDVADGRRLVAFTGFNAELPDIVQIGGVWTPPALRGRGLARAAVAGQLLEARARGVARAVLFTQRHNLAAQKAYASLGFHAVGEYGLVLLARPAVVSVMKQ